MNPPEDSLDFQVRPLTGADRTWVADFLREQWGSQELVSRGQLYDGVTLPGFVAEGDGSEVWGLVTYRVHDAQAHSSGAGKECEVVTLNSVREERGVGSALIAAVRRQATAEGAARLWLITTNDNVAALRFYQRRGFVLARLHRDAIAQSRSLKPEIPLVGAHGIPIRDEIELEMILT